MNLDELRLDSAIKQKKGLPFIMSSVVIWCAIFIVQLLDLPVLTKNLYTFCCTPILGVLPFIIGRLIKADMQNKENPLNKLGLLFTANQVLYLLIVMWIYAAVPDKMLMVFAMVFGGHLLPYSWLYQSKSYMVFSICIPVAALVIGLNFAPYMLAAIMIGVEIIFSVCLWLEVKALPRDAAL